MNMEMGLCCLHTANDDTKDGETPLNDLERFYNLHGGGNIAVAGGINPDLIRKINIFHPEVVIAGEGFCEWLKSLIFQWLPYGVVFY